MKNACSLSGGYINHKSPILRDLRRQNVATKIHTTNFINVNMCYDSLISRRSSIPTVSRRTADHWTLGPVHTSNNVEATSTSLPQTATMSNDSIVKFRPFDKVETNWTCPICFDIDERTKFRSTLLPKPATLLPKNGNNVEETFDTVKRIVQLVAFDNVASTFLLVWTELYGVIGTRRRDRISNLCPVCLSR